jgi:hypothetical protein
MITAMMSHATALFPASASSSICHQSQSLHVTMCGSHACLPAGIIIASCFSAATKVVVRGKEAPMAMRDLCVGQEVLCFNSGPDMHTPGAPAWCEVKNFVSLRPAATRLLVTCGMVTSHITDRLTD